MAVPAFWVWARATPFDIAPPFLSNCDNFSNWSYLISKTTLVFDVLPCGPPSHVHTGKTCIDHWHSLTTSLVTPRLKGRLFSTFFPTPSPLYPVTNCLPCAWMVSWFWQASLCGCSPNKSLHCPVTCSLVCFSFLLTFHWGLLVLCQGSFLSGVNLWGENRVRERGKKEKENCTPEIPLQLIERWDSGKSSSVKGISGRGPGVNKLISLSSQTGQVYNLFHLYGCP